MSDDPQAEEQLESRIEATFAVGLVIALQVTLAVTSLGERLDPGRPPRLGLADPGRARGAAGRLARVVGTARAARTARASPHGGAALVGVITVANALALVVLIVSLLQAQEKSGGELLLKGATIWGTNVLTFGLLFWEVDRGGPARRREPEPPPRDFQFPQDENPTLAEPGWHPRLLDYVYLSFTNAIAFSPTDVMPLRRRVKWMMLAESGVSAVTVLLVAARAVNILR